MTTCAELDQALMDYFGDRSRSAGQTKSGLLAFASEAETLAETIHVVGACEDDEDDRKRRSGQSRMTYAELKRTLMDYFEDKSRSAGQTKKGLITIAGEAQTLAETISDADDDEGDDDGDD